MKKLIVLSGLPSSGRTSYIETIMNDKTYVIESKEIRKSITGKYDDYTVDNDIFDFICKKCKEKVEEGYNTIIIDSSNLRNYRRIKYFTYLSNIFDRFELVIIDCDTETCIKRDEEKGYFLKRGAAHIQNSSNMFEEPNDAVKTIYDSILRIDGKNIKH